MALTEYEWEQLRADAEDERFQGGLYSVFEGLGLLGQNQDWCRNFYLLNEGLNMHVVQSAEVFRS
jgi:hypothetical protein